VDAVAKNNSTSFYGNLVALSESPLVEGLLYAGTDDGLIQVTESDGQSWRRIERFSGVPEMTYVSDIEASLHDADTVYAALNNHKRADFKPYLVKSTDRGRSWRSIAGDLPQRGSVYAVAEDHVDPDLLFAGTEFGVFFTIDGGTHWIELTGGMPTIAVRDIEIQRRESDLVLASFGRGFFILDDYSPLRGIDKDELQREALLFPVKTAWMYIPRHRLGIPAKGFQGDGYFLADNPPFGAIFTYYLRDDLESGTARRRREEEQATEEGRPLRYPSWEELRAEDWEQEPSLILTIEDEDGQVVRRLSGPVEAGFHRVAWDLRYPAPDPTDLSEPEDPAPWDTEPRGPMVAPGRFRVSLAKRIDGQITPLAGPGSFEAVPLVNATLPASDRQSLEAFQRKTSKMQRAVLGSIRAVEQAQERLDHLAQAIHDTPGATGGLADRVVELDRRLKQLRVVLEGDETIASRSEPTTPSLAERVQRIIGGHWSSTSVPTETHARNYAIAARQLGELLPALQQLIEVDLTRVESDVEAAGGPWTPGRVPRWDDD
ncbi:MAG: glycosyl hydrolase, partial [Acidobacteriota bacterium]